MTARYAFPRGGITLCQGCHDDGLLQGHPIGRIVEPRSGLPCDICQCESDCEPHTDHSDLRVCQGVGCLMGDV